ncbi:Pentatricopeptide repeat-containing protein [Hordeum vulgare]|nr:Pentatricopeptide repeat-containing protein [Hordeum vulgare]
MGTYLSTPKTEKQSADGEGARVCYGLASMQGWRTTMEDAVYIVYTMIGDVCLYIVGKDEYDELVLSEVIFAITSAVKDVCAKPPTERLFLDKYGRICLCLDEIVWQAISELGGDAKSLLLSLEPPSSSDASGEYFFSDYGLDELLCYVNLGDVLCDVI